MRAVYKYPVPRKSRKFSIMLPINAKPLRITWQNEDLFLWADVDTEVVQIERKFQQVGTGQEVPSNGKYVTTYDDGPFVIHLFEI